jgi:hypothetical protein
MISSLGCCVLDNQQVFFCSETILFQLWCDLHLCILGNFYCINSHWNPSVSGHSKTFAFAVWISRKKFQEFYQQLEHYRYAIASNGLLGFLYSSQVVTFFAGTWVVCSSLCIGFHS